MISRSSGKPGSCFLMLMGCTVIHDNMNIQLRRYIGVNIRKKMKEIIFKDRNYRISTRDFRKMMKMFDCERAALISSGYYFIPERSICADNSRKCIDCSFYDSRKKVNGCIYLFKKVLGEKDSSLVHFLDQGIFWDSKFDKEVRQALKKMKILLSNVEDA